MHSASANPRIPRLVSLESALARLASLSKLVDAKELGLVEAAGAVLASRLEAKADLPSQPIANTDGWAVNAEDLIGSSAYSAAVLQSPQWVDAGDVMPESDAVLSPECITFLAPDVAEAAGSVVSGEGVRLPGQDIAAGEVLLEEGTRLEPRHIGLLQACGFQTVGRAHPTTADRDRKRRRRTAWPDDPHLARGGGRTCRGCGVRTWRPGRPCCPVPSPWS